jgi:hypothetical protein
MGHNEPGFLFHPLTLPLRDTSDVSRKRILVVKAAAQEVLYLLISEPLDELGR